MEKAKYLVISHNIIYDIRVISAECNEMAAAADHIRNEKFYDAMHGESEEYEYEIYEMKGTY